VEKEDVAGDGSFNDLRLCSWLNGSAAFDLGAFCGMMQKTGQIDCGERKNQSKGAEREEKRTERWTKLGRETSSSPQSKAEQKRKRWWSVIFEELKLPDPIVGFDRERKKTLGFDITFYADLGK
jgi:hypothetical protein